jgi:copper chaperone CopZ
MKILKSIVAPVFLSLVMLVSFSACGQSGKAELKEAKIKTEFHCPNGKAMIEKELVKEAGVKSVVADLETKVVTVTYQSNITNQEKIVAAIEKIGYRTEFTPENKEINKACSHEAPPAK